MQFKYYVLNYNHNKQKVEPFNIFNNRWVQVLTEKEIKKYLYSPKNYKYESFFGDKETIYGFDGLVKRIDGIIGGEEWGRYEYEMGVCYKFETDCNKIQATDCYTQAHMNIEIITREIIYQYKQYKKSIKDGERHKSIKK